MKRFVKVALLLAAFSVLACGAAFAAYPLDLPGDLVSPTDVRLISQDWAGDNEGDTLMAPADKTKSGLSNPAYLEYVVSTDGTDLIFSNDYGYFVNVDHLVEPVGAVSFDKTLVRSLFTSAIDMKFRVDTEGDVSPFTFALRGGAEKSKAAKDRVPAVDTTFSADDCTIACDNFYFQMGDKTIISTDAAVNRTLGGTINWTGTGDAEFYVECCDYFGLVASGDGTGPVNAFTNSRDFVVAHLSEKPFLRARAADALYVGVTAADPTSKDFRASYWKTDHFNTKGAVDVPEGKTYHMGVVYSCFGDCVPCDGPVCDNLHLPYVAVTNLGTASVNVEANITDSEGLVIDSSNMITSNTSWVCNLWCGLCEYDDFMSSDKGSIGGLYPASAKNRSSLYDCACHILPAFTETWKGAGNMDWNYRAVGATGTTKIDGRFNTAWNCGDLSLSGICDSCTSNAVYVYWPCPCLEDSYEKALGYTDLLFAEVTDLKLESFKEDKAEGAYVTREAVLKLNAAEVVKSSDFFDKKAANIVVTKLDWTMKAADLNDAGLVGLKGLDGDWWREQFWNKLAISVNGHALNATDVENVSANDFTVDELSFLTVLDGPQRDLSTSTNVDVRLFVFVMDSDVDAVKYYKTSTGNRFLVVYDGNLDGKFTYSASIAKADAPVPAKLAVTPTELKLYLDSTTTGTVKAENATGTVKWTVDQSEEFVSISPDQGAEVTVTALKVTPGNVKVIATDDKTSADCVVTVDAKKPVSPDQPGGGSSGGCSMGFAPAALLLLAPLFFLKK